MKNIKDIVIGIFAVIGFTAIVTGFTNEAEQEHTVPESHVWEMHLHNSVRGYFAINKVTGEVRAYDLRGADTKNFRSNYSVSKESME
tara:strand:- start:709 stop:969 length:261 start_codon:yes stop_codon:yes gene_type:complete